MICELGLMTGLFFPEPGPLLYPSLFFVICLFVPSVFAECRPGTVLGVDICPRTRSPLLVPAPSSRSDSLAASALLFPVWGDRVL